MIDKIKSCPFCGGEVKVHGPEDWKPTFYDPDSGGDPYGFYCECGMKFDTNSYDYEEAVKKFNTRKPMDRIVEQLEEVSFVETVEEYAEINLLLLDDAIEIVKAGGIDE